MEPTELTIEILKGIRDGVHTLNGRVDETNSRLGRLERRQVDADVRVSTLLTGVASAVDDMRDLFREDRGLRARVDDLERRMGDVERRS
jgi:hypothetical protein